MPDERMTVVFAEIVAGVAVAGLSWTGGRAYERYRLRRPLMTHIETNPAVIHGQQGDWVSAAYYFDCEVANLPGNPPTRGSDWWSWARSNHGTPAIFSELAITLVPSTAQTVVIDGFRPQLVSCERLRRGSIVVHPVGGADIIRRGVGLRLGPAGVASTFREAGSGTEVEGFSFALAAGEPAKLSVEVSAYDGTYQYAWRGILDIVVAGRRRSIPLDVSGQPFVLFGSGTAPHYEWKGNTWIRSTVFEQSASD